MIRALSSTSTELAVGGVWTIAVATYDAYGVPVDDTVVVTVTKPDASTATPTVTDGVVQYTVAAAGRYVARAVAAVAGAVDFAAYVTGVTPAAGMPTLVDLVGDREEDFGYLGQNSATDEQVQDALDAEAAAQRAACRVPAAYGADLRQALLRRVARNLAMRRIPLAVLLGDADAGSTTPPGRDPEVRRFEAPYRKLPVG